MEEAHHPVTSSSPRDLDNKKNIRHAEKRRTATCSFADRVAQISLDHYRSLIPESERLPQACLATIVAYSKSDGDLTVVGFGVGTKFLSELILGEEAKSSEYGRRVRDCHAEVLARRAFRRQLTLEILQDMKSSCTGASLQPGGILLERSSSSSSSNNNQSSPSYYRLRPGVTLHFYTSSAPCGNAALKKFAKMSKEKYRDDLGPYAWPQEPHEPIHCSSIPLGQLCLLVKKDSSSEGSTNATKVKKDNDNGNPITPRLNSKAWPATMSDDWAPPGTTIVGMKHKGSIHTCSDKICRWNFLGLQGSLLASLLERPIYLSSLAVGRKFTSCICRRAVCCRLESGHGDKSGRISRKPKLADDVKQDAPLPSNYTYRQNHPAVMGTAVYMDDSGVVVSNSDVRGQDVRFHSSRSWCWWPFLDLEEYPGYVEQINGSSGYVWKATQEIDYEHSGMDDDTKISRVSTESLTRLFLQVIDHLSCQRIDDTKLSKETAFNTLEDLRNLKTEISSFYETSKDELLTKHRVFRHWRRRSLPPEY